jgi:peroxiredoxin
MKDIQRNYQAKGVKLVAIGSNDAAKYPDDDFSHMKQRADQEGFNFLYLRDESQEVARAYGGTHTPHVFLLDRTCALRYRGAIDDNYDDPSAVQHPYLRNALDALLSGQAPDPAVSQAVGCTIKWK